MAMNDFSHESIQDNETISRYLLALIDGFKNKHLSFNVGTRELELFPQNMIEFDIKAQKNRGKSTISLTFSWKETDEAMPTQDKFEIRSNK